MGDLRRGRARDRVRHLPQGPPPADQRGVRPAARQASRRGPGRQGHRHPGDLRDAVRLGRLARPRRPADPERPADRRRPRRGRQRAADRHHRGADRRASWLSAVSGVAKGIQWLSNINMVLAHRRWRCSCSWSGRRCSSSTSSRPRSPPTSATCRRWPAAPTPRAATVATWLSCYTVFYWAWWISWTPFVGMFIARISQGPHDPPVRHRRAAGAEPGEPGLVRRLRRVRDQAADGRHRHLRRRRRRGAAVHAARELPVATRHQHPGDGPGGASSSSPVPTRRRS